MHGNPPAREQGGAVIAAWLGENGRRYLVGKILPGLGFLPFYFLLRA